MDLNWAQLLHRPEIQFDQSVLEGAIRGKRILITGAGGSIGTSLTRLVQGSDPAQLLLLDSHEASLFHLRQQFADRAERLDVRYILADLRDRSKIQQVFRRGRIDVAFHLAAYKHVPLAEDNVDQYVGVNLLGTLNVVEAAKEAGTSTVVYPSSDKAVTPRGVYAATKRISERVLHALAYDGDQPALRIVRLVNVFGTQGSVVEVFARQIHANLPLTITDPRMDRYWMTMAEATHLLVAGATRQSFEGFYMLDVGEPVCIAETARRVYALLRPAGGEPSLRTTATRPGERLHEALTYPTERCRATDLPGLLTIELPAPTDDSAAWVHELGRLREYSYDWEPAALKAWLLELASRPSLADAAHPSTPARVR